MADTLVGTLGRLCWPYKSLPPGICEAAQREALSELTSALKDLRKPDTKRSLLAYTLRRLERVRDYGREPADLHVSIAVEFWRLVQNTKLDYRLRRQFAGALHQRLRGLRRQYTPARGLHPVTPQQTDPDILSAIREVVNWRTVQKLLWQELERSRRGAPLENPNHHQLFVESLAPLVNEFRHWTPVEEADKIVEELSVLMDPSQRSIILFGRLMLMALPTPTSHRYIEDGRLFEWWDKLPRGANARYSLMWIALPARAAKCRWASGSPWDPNPVVPRHRITTIMDIIAGVMSLPVDDGKTYDMDHFVDDCQWAFLGGTMYRLVSKFLVYSLEPTLELGKPFPEGSMWATFELLCRRLTPCMIHTGVWTLHIRTLILELTRVYYIRVCRERFREPGCLAHESCRMTPACDDAFVRLLRPLLVDALSLQSTGFEHLHTIMVSLSFVSRLSMMHEERWEEIKAYLQDCIQDLEDPMSARHNCTLQILTSFTPLLVYVAPSLVVDAAHLALQGIDTTNPIKTVITAAFFVNLFVQVPALDLSTVDLPEKLPFVLDDILPIGVKGATVVPGATPGELQICTSTLPDLCCSLLEKYFEYAQAMPKPSKGDGMAALEVAGPRLLATALFLVVRQADTAFADRLLGRLIEWLPQALLPNAAKGVCMLVGAFSLAHQRASLQLVEACLKKLPSGGGLASMGESEVLWHFGLLGAAARFAGTDLPPKRAELEAHIQAALGDTRKPVRKAGAKLCRRVLTGLTAPYTRDLTGEGSLEEALCRWAGARAAQWGCPVRPMEFHVPTAEELDFARALVEYSLTYIREKSEGSDEDIHTALSLAKSVVRGVACLYPDERGEDDPQLMVSFLPNDMGARILNEIADVLLTLCPKLGSPCHPFQAEACTTSRPKLLCKALQTIVGLVRGERRPEIPDMLQIRGFDGNVRGHISFDPLTSKVHFMSAWRDVSLFWYYWEVLALMNLRLYHRPVGFKLQGIRQRLADLLCQYTMHESNVVSSSASDCLQTYLRVHYEAKRHLLEDMLLPQQEMTISGAAQITSDKSHLAEAAMQGFARTAVRIFASEVWRRGVPTALRFASVIVRTVHAFSEEGQPHADVRPAALAMQYELIAKWCSARVGSGCSNATLENVKEACEAANSLLDLLRRPSTHWRTRVCILGATGPALRVLHLSGMEGMDPAVLKTWLGEVLGCLTGNAVPQLTEMAVAELTTAMRSALRRPDSTLAAVLKPMFPRSADFLNQAAKLMAGLHQGHMGADGGPMAQADAVQCVVHGATGGFGVPHLAWASCPSSHVWTQHAAFFQTYITFRIHLGDTGVIEDLRALLASMQSQPKSEAECHVLFLEVLAGTLRAARRWPESQLAELWKAIGPLAADALRTSEESSIRSWQFVVWYALTGVSRRLRPRSDETSEDLAIGRLAAFLTKPTGEDIVTPSLPPISMGENSASSHTHVTKLRLIQVMLVGLRRKRPAISDDARIAIIRGITPALKEGVAHPYKQVHEESAKALVISLLTDVDHPALHDLHTWLEQRAHELGPAIPTATKDSQVSTACQGLVYCFIHGLLARRMRRLTFRSAGLLLAATSAEDHELRALAGLALGILGQSPQRGYEATELAKSMASFCTVPTDANAAQRTRRLEAAAALLGTAAMRHHFTLHFANGGEGKALCRETLIGLLQEKRVEVRHSCQSALAPLLGLEGVEACTKQVKAFDTLGSKDGVDQAVYGLGAMLSAASSLGVPAWLGAVIEALAKFGRKPEVKKEVERMIQGFLKQQQQSRDLWKRCQSRLTEAQMDLLKARQGTLSYCS